MGLGSSLADFDRAMGIVGDRLREARLTAVEDRPAANHVSDHIAQALTDLVSLQKRSQAAVKTSIRCAHHPLDEAATRHALQISGEALCDLLDTYLACVARTDFEFKDVPHTLSGAEWRSWGSVVRASLLQCQAPLLHGQRCLITCWDELAERLSPVPSYAFYCSAPHSTELPQATENSDLNSPSKE